MTNKKEETHLDRCVGCKTDNYYLCISFPGKAPQHAIRHAQWLRQRSKDRAKEREKESLELLSEVEARVFQRERVAPVASPKVFRREDK